MTYKVEVEGGKGKVWGGVYGWGEGGGVGRGGLSGGGDKGIYSTTCHVLLCLINRVTCMEFRPEKLDCALKVTFFLPYFTYRLTYLLTYSLIHSLARSLTYLPICVHACFLACLLVCLLLSFFPSYLLVLSGFRHGNSKHFTGNIFNRVVVSPKIRFVATNRVKRSVLTYIL